MFDPRNEIVALFTSSHIGASTQGGTRYVGIDIREDNEEAKLKYDNIGVIILEPPETNNEVINIDGKTTEDTVMILGNMWVKREQLMKHPDVFINSILNTFHETILTNHLDISADCRLIVFNWARTIPSETKDMYRRTFMLTGLGYNIVA